MTDYKDMFFSFISTTVKRIDEYVDSTKDATLFGIYTYLKQEALMSVRKKDRAEKLDSMYGAINREMRWFFKLEERIILDSEETIKITDSHKIKCAFIASFLITSDVHLLHDAAFSKTFDDFFMGNDELSDGIGTPYGIYYCVHTYLTDKEKLMKRCGVND